MKILLIEDQKKVVSFIKKGLTSEGYVLDVAMDGEDGLHFGLTREYDLIILDLMLPKLDGLTICQKLRESKKTLPIIMLTAKDAVDDRVAGLDAGADDYLTKPFSFTELLARIRAHIRRTSKILGENILTVGEIILKPENFTVERAGQQINLSATEFKLLKYLMENPNRVLSKTKILENVWEYDFDPESNIVDVYIKYLRDKIDKDFKKKMLTTVRGIGYRLCA